MAKAGSNLLPYVRVYSELVSDDSAFLEGVAEFEALRDLLWSNDALRNFWCAPSVKGVNREMVVRRALESAGASQRVIGVTVVMLRKSRQSQLDNFVRELRIHADQRCNIARGTVESAHGLDAAALAEVSGAFEKVLNKKVVLKHRLNGSLLGGLRVRLGQRVLDASLGKKLQEAKNRMLKKRA